MDVSGIGIRGVAFALGLAVTLGGCASMHDHRGYLVDSVLVDSVQPGVDNRTSVEKTLGRPTFVSQFGQSDWYYVSQDTRTPAFAGPRTVDQTILRIRFDPAGNVAAIDKRGMQDVARIRPNGDQTPTLGKDRSLLDDLFGNIGAVGAAGMGGQQTPNGPGPNGS